MKFLRAFTICVSAVLVMLFAAACGGDTTSESSSAGSIVGVANEYKDGTYKVSAPNYDDSGYKATVEVTVKDGKVFAVDCNADAKDGSTKKAYSESGNYGMKKGGAQYEWHEEIAFFEKHVVENGIASVGVNKDGKTDAITGCTIAVADYVDLINEALDKAKK